MPTARPLMMLVACPLDRLPARAGVVLGDRHEQERHAQTDQRRPVQVPEGEGAAVVRLRDRDEAERGEHGRDDHGLVERVDDRVRAPADAREEGPDHRGDDGDAADRERVEPQLSCREGGAEQHHGDRRDRVRLEQVSCHPGAVADVVADVVGDDGRVARVVLGNAGLDLPHQVGADVGGLGVDAAAEAGEDGDQRAAEGEPDQVVHGRLGRVLEPTGQHPVVAGDAEQPEADDEQPGDGAGAEGDVERGLDAFARCLGRAGVRAHGHVHADEAGCGREERADQEPDRRPPAELGVEADQHERHHGDGGDRRVLLAQVRCRTLLHGARDLPHALVAGRLTQQPPGQVEAVQDRDCGTRERERDGVVSEEVHPSSGVKPDRERAPTARQRGALCTHSVPCSRGFGRWR
jgi:hypothetical protein